MVENAVLGSIRPRNRLAGGFTAVVVAMTCVHNIKRYNLNLQRLYKIRKEAVAVKVQKDEL